VACWKGFAEPVDGILPDGFLYVEVVLRHADIGVSHDTLDGSQVYTQCLHLADIGMSAAVWRQERYFGNGLQVKRRRPGPENPAAEKRRKGKVES